MEKLYIILETLCMAGLAWFITIFFFDRRTIQATECGHKTKITDWVEAFGEKAKTKLPVNDNKTSYCHRCLEKMAIRCAWCGKVIFIGDPITLYSPRDDNAKMPDYAVLYDKELNSYVGCLGWECAETGADRSGFWQPPGEVCRVRSPLEMSIQDMEQGGDGIIIISDLSKP